MAAVTVGGGYLIGAATVTAGASLVGGILQSNSAKEAARIQARENARIEKLKIRFANEESSREMFRFNKSQEEGRRQFNLSLAERKADRLESREQFERSFGLREKEFDLQKDQTIFNNRMALQKNIQDMINNDHNLRFTIMDKKRQLIRR